MHLAVIIFISCFGAGLNEIKTPGEPVLINFRRFGNSSGLNSARAYIPPNESLDTPIPEVVDNRENLQETSETPAVVIDSVTKIDLSEIWTTPNPELQGPLRDAGRDGRRYSYPQYHVGGRFAQRSNAKGTTLKLAVGSGRSSFSEAIRIEEMSCRYSGQDLYFRASIVAMKKTDHPLVDNVNNEACRIAKVKTEYRLNFEKENFWNCGVTDCSTEAGNFFCLTVRFPTISGLRLKDDTTVTLQCKSQDKTASHTTQINVKTLNTAARMAPRVATGGLKNAFQTDIGLFRKSYGSENLFDVKINSGGTVVLGEEILLRALVRDGDGWKYSRIGEVNVQYVETREKQRVMNSLWILDAEGCRNPDIAEISPSDQYRVAPLESYLIFEAFMFESMKETDEMVVSVKVIGCLEGEDCRLNCPKDPVRKTRSLQERSFEKDSKSINITDWQSDIAFKVLRRAPKTESTTNRLDYVKLIVPYSLIIFILIVSVALLCIVKNFLRQRSAPVKEFNY